MYTPETFDLVMFPRLHSTKGPAVAKFKKALSEDLVCDKELDMNLLLSAAHTYWDAFLMGNAEAGVNVLRILMKTNFNAHSHGTEVLERPTRIAFEMLSEAGHPIVSYYEALTKLCINGKGGEDWDMMDALAAEGNEYASALIKSYEEYEAELAE